MFLSSPLLSALGLGEPNAQTTTDGAMDGLAATWRGGGGYFCPRLGAAYKFVTFCDELNVTYEKLASWQTGGRGVEAIVLTSKITHPGDYRESWI